MYGCVNKAMYSRILIKHGRNLHHMTVKSLTSRHDKWEIDDSLKYLESRKGHIWYLYNGGILKVSTEDMDRLRAIDEIYLNSPEFKRAYQYV